MSHWSANRVVVKDFYISFKPMGKTTGQPEIDLSGPAFVQVRHEPVYIAISGRPAGFMNFLREHIGFPRRFEFLLSSHQCVERLGSPSTQTLSTSSLKGLNTVRVGTVRPLREAMIAFFFALMLLASAILGRLAPYPAASPSEDAVADAALQSAGWGESLLLVAFAAVVGLYAAFLMFIGKRNWVSVSEGGEEAISFVISPSLLESRSTNIPLAELNKIPLVFAALKAR